MSNVKVDRDSIQEMIERNDNCTMNFKLALSFKFKQVFQEFDPCVFPIFSQRNFLNY